MRFLSVDLSFVTDAGASSNSMTENLTSNSIDIRTVYGCSLQFKYTGAPVGTMTVEATDDEIIPAVSQNWVTVLNSSVAVSGTGDHIYNIAGLNTGFIRLRYTFTSGTGTLTGKIVTKGV
jgi:hypothetical protein